MSGAVTSSFWFLLFLLFIQFIQQGFLVKFQLSADDGKIWVNSFTFELSFFTDMVLKNPNLTLLCKSIGKSFFLFLLE